MYPYLNANKSLFNTDKTELILYVLDKYDVTYRSNRVGWQKVRCFNPYAHPRGDKNPSGSVNTEHGYYKCFSCDLKGDGYEILKTLEGWNVKQVNEAFGGNPVNENEIETWI